MNTYEKFNAILDLAVDKNKLTAAQREIIMNNAKPSYELIELVSDYVFDRIPADSDCFVHALLATH